MLGCPSRVIRQATPSFPILPAWSLWTLLSFLTVLFWQPEHSPLLTAPLPPRLLWRVPGTSQLPPLLPLSPPARYPFCLHLSTPHPLRLGFCREVLSLKHKWNPQKPLKTPGSNHTGCLLLTTLLCGPAPITPFLSWHQIPSNPESAQELTFTGP